MTRADETRIPPGLCLDFKPTVAQVKRHFSNAYPIPSATVYKDRYTPCYAEGTVRFTDGSRAEWTLYSSGAGYFKFDEGDVSAFFARGYKWNDPFECLYGDDGDKC